MLLTIDVGNTDTTFGVFDGERLRSVWHMATTIRRMADEYAAFLINLMRHEGLEISDIKGISLCSTVPPLISTLDDLFQRYFHLAPLVVGGGVKTGVRIRMDNPREVGPDRIVNAAAAHHLYGGPVIVVDMGTATTFDTVSKEGDYIGGAIAPGIMMAAEALYTRTSRLSRVELVRPKRAIGTSTVAAMQSGLIFGYAGLIEGVVARIQAELEEKARVIATGGLATLMARETAVFDEVSPELTLVGLRLVYEMNNT